jgi:3-deoxy-D-manno-octulosonic-acid transferase
LALYRLLVALIAPLLVARFFWRVLRGHEEMQDFAERLGGGDAVPEGAIWLHAASNGELASARPLIEALLAQAPEIDLLVTTNTVSGKALAESWCEPRLSARLAPLDLRVLVARFANRHRPRALVVIENEIWPNRLDLAMQRGLPVFLFGARLSERSAAFWEKLGLGARITAAITALSAQDAGSEAAFLRLGLPHARLLPRVNLKQSVQMPEPDDLLPWPRAETVLAASTHEGEEALILQGFQAARARRPGLRLILAPRHPRRAPEIAALVSAAGLHCATRSHHDAPDAPVYLADTLGEMENWYGSAAICVIGGTFVPKGGHTPFEPARFDCALLHGPDVANFREAFAALDAAGGALALADGAALCEALVALSPGQAEAMARSARATLARLGGGEGPAQLAEALLERLV